MRTEILDSQKHILVEVDFVKESSAWTFTFDNQLRIRLECFWRILSEKGILWTSKDHNQQYGSNIINLLEEINLLLIQKGLLKIERIELTGDLKLYFEENIYLEAYTDSTGFESWEINQNSKTIIGLGRGEKGDFS